jgi:VWFA-related protein
MKSPAILLTVFGSLIAVLVLGLTPVAVSDEVTLSQIDKSNFPNIDVYVSIVDSSGKPIEGIEQTAFTVTENKTSVKITDFPPTGQQRSGPINTVLVIDHSSSMDSGGKMDGAKEAAINYVQLMDQASQTCLISFGDQVEKILDFTTDKNRLIAAINHIATWGGTAFYDATYMALEELQGISGRNVVLALTDGLENQSSHTIDTVIQYATEQNLPVYTVGLGSDVDAAGLERLALQTSGKYAFSPTAQELAALYGLRAAQIQQEYRLSYTSPDPDRNGIKRHVFVKVNVGTTPHEKKGWYNPGGLLGGSPTQNRESNWTLFTVALLSLILLAIIPYLRRYLANASDGDGQPVVPDATAKPAVSTFSTPSLGEPATGAIEITLFSDSESDKAAGSTTAEPAAQKETSGEVEITLLTDEDGDEDKSAATGSDEPAAQEETPGEVKITLLADEDGDENESPDEPPPTETPTETEPERQS